MRYTRSDLKAFRFEFDNLAFGHPRTYKLMVEYRKRNRGQIRRPCVGELMLEGVESDRIKIEGPPSRSSTAEWAFTELRRALKSPNTWPRASKHKMRVYRRRQQEMGTEDWKSAASGSGPRNDFGVMPVGRHTLFCTKSLQLRMF